MVLPIHAKQHFGSVACCVTDLSQNQLQRSIRG